MDLEKLLERCRPQLSRRLGHRAASVRKTTQRSIARPNAGLAVHGLAEPRVS